MALLGIVYLIVAWMTALAERSYFDAVARETGEIPTLADVGFQMRKSPRQIFRIVSKQTTNYLRLLLRRQDNPDLEFRRRIALLMLLVLVAFFVLIPMR